MDDDLPFYLVLHGQEGSSPKFLLKDGLVTDKKLALKKDTKTEFEFKCQDLGKVNLLVLRRLDRRNESIRFRLKNSSWDRKKV